MSEVVTAYFPGMSPSDPFVMKASATTDPAVDEEDSVGIQTSIAVQEQRRLYWGVGGRTHFVWQTMPLTQTQAQLVRDFIRSQQGQGFPFYIFWFEQEYFYRTTVGIADGTSNLLMPFKGCVQTPGGTPGPTEVLDNGSPITFGFSSSFGTGGEDRLTSLQGPPAAGHTITATFYGQKRYPVRIETARPQKNYFNKGNTKLPYSLWSFQMVEVL